MCLCTQTAGTNYAIGGIILFILAKLWAIKLATPEASTFHGHAHLLHMCITFNFGILSTHAHIHTYIHMHCAVASQKTLPTALAFFFFFWLMRTVGNVFGCTQGAHAAGDDAAYGAFCTENGPTISDICMASIGGKRAMKVGKSSHWLYLAARAEMWGRIKLALVQCDLLGAVDAAAMPDADLSFPAMWRHFESVLGETLPKDKEDEDATVSVGTHCHPIHVPPPHSMPFPLGTDQT